MKLDNLQPSGSFKARGIGHFIHLRANDNNDNDTRPPHILTSSGGNAGLAAACTAQALGLACTVILPTSAPPLMVHKLLLSGATTVEQHGRSWVEADAHLREVIVPAVEARGDRAVYTPPFDHPDIWTGHATLVDELRRQLPPGDRPDVIICSVGGGGLLNGIVQGLEAAGWADGRTAVLAVETVGADSLHQSVRQGRLVTLPAITSQALSLGARAVTPRTFAHATERQAWVRSVALPDAEAARACVRLADEEGLNVELACGVSVAALLQGPGRLAEMLGRPVRPDDKVVLVVCGGKNVTVQMLEQWRKEFGGGIEEEVEREMGKRKAQAEVIGKGEPME